MKTRITTLIFLFTILLFAGCTKTGDVVETKEEKVIRFLTGTGNKYWHLKEIYVSSVKQTLTDSQLRFTKTYTVDPTNTDATRPRGSFVNSDGYQGTWKLTGAGDFLTETFTNNPAGPVAVQFGFNEISADKLDIEYTQNMKTQREVYYAY